MADHFFHDRDWADLLSHRVACDARRTAAADGALGCAARHKCIEFIADWRLLIKIMRSNQQSEINNRQFLLQFPSCNRSFRTNSKAMTPRLLTACWVKVLP